MMKISQLDPATLTDEQLTKLLYGYKKDDGKSGDCIFVPGSSRAVEYRVPKAVDLYKQGRARKLLFSGGVSWDETKTPEAVLMKAKALSLGIAAKDILVEDRSLHTKENVLASLLVLDRAIDLHRIKRLLLVTASYHMPRVYLMMRTYMPSWIEYSLCPVDDYTTTAENWHLSPFGRKRVETEARKLISYVQQGIIKEYPLIW
ncbi:YdcF family protein [Shouchella clausii]|uniref:YdcF family protein n=2 Tax=Shouchella clausii TaxID=79880 RepID=UPI003462DCC8